jgi:hypothetical protein
VQFCAHYLYEKRGSCVRIGDCHDAAVRLPTKIVGDRGAHARLVPFANCGRERRKSPRLDGHRPQQCDEVGAARTVGKPLRNDGQGSFWMDFVPRIASVPRRGRPVEHIAFFVCVSGSMERSIVSLDGWVDIAGHRKHVHPECVAIAKWVALYSALTERSVHSIEGPQFNV